MDQLKRKRTRTENWDASDKALLRQLVEERIQIVEDKRTDTNTTKTKREAWREITLSFNEISGTMREVSQLQSQWRTTKMKAKANVSAFKKSRNATGGGSAPKEPDDEDLRLVELIPHEFEQDENEFDCDYTLNKENEPTAANSFKDESHNTAQADIQEGEDNSFQMVEFLEDEIEILLSSPEKALRCSPPKKEPKRNKKIPKEDLMKEKFFNLEKKKKEKELQYMKEEHEAKLHFLKVQHDEDMSLKARERELLNVQHNENMRLKEREREKMEELHLLKLKVIIDSLLFSFCCFSFILVFLMLVYFLLIFLCLLVRKIYM